MKGYDSLVVHSLSRTGDGRWELDFTVPASSPYFRQHFEAFRLLPAVAEIDILANTLDEVLPDRVRVDAIRQCKFVKPLVPERRCRLEISMIGEGLVRFSFFTHEGEKLSFGKIMVGDL